MADPTMDALINAAKTIGCKVFMHPAGSGQSFYYTDGTNIGYCEVPKRRMPSLTTVHKPNLTSGTGFQFGGPNDPVDATLMLRCMLCHVPPGFSGLSSSVVKWRNWDEFHRASKFNSEYIEV